MLSIKEKEPYIILPKQRYNLSTYEPHTTMQGDFTFFCDFKLNSEKMEEHYGICMRPGMHMGTAVKADKDMAWISFDFWFNRNGEQVFDNVYFPVEETGISKNDRYFMFVQHKLNEKKFCMYLNSEKFNEVYYMEKEYDGILVDYKETSFNLGCGNYSKTTPKKDRYYSSVNFYNLGLIENVKYSYDDIISFIEKTKNDEMILSKSMDNLVMYFNFNLQNIYKVWDLSGHCNFIQKNMHIYDEDVYLTDSDFAKDYTK